MKKMVWFAIMMVSLTPRTALMASDGAPPRIITVSGEAEVKVVPDEVVICLGVETHHRDLAAVKRNNSERVRKLLAIIRGRGVEDKDVLTSYLNLRPEYRGAPGQRAFIGYVQQAVIQVTLRNLSGFDSLLTEALQAGMNTIEDIEFQTSELEQRRAEARTLAAEAARRKAVALSSQFALKLGKPRVIQEGAGNGEAVTLSRLGTRNVSNYSFGYSGDSDSSQNGLLAPGTISVQANVTITFDLE